MNYAIYPRNETALWCERIHEEIALLACLLDEKPQAHEAPQKIDLLRNLYHILEASNQPYNAEQLYNHLTQAVLHLRLSYEEVSRSHPDRSDHYYDLAYADWQRFNRKLAQTSISD